SRCPGSGRGLASARPLRHRTSGRGRARRTTASTVFGGSCLDEPSRSRPATSRVSCEVTRIQEFDLGGIWRSARRASRIGLAKLVTVAQCAGPTPLVRAFQIYVSNLDEFER